MQCLIRILTAFILVSAAFAEAPIPADLPALIEQAHVALTPATYDIGTCRLCAKQLEQYLATNPKGSDLPDLLLLCAKCEAACGDLPHAGENASRVVDQFPLSNAAPMAYEIALKAISDGGAKPSVAAGLARNYAEGLSGDPRAEHYWRECLNWHQQAGNWNDVLSVGLYCLNAHDSRTVDPALQLAVADAALKTNDTTRAKELFQQLATRRDNAPQNVLAHRYLAAGDNAQQHDQAAWAIYKKNSHKAEFARHDVAAAAAQSLWELQEASYDNFVLLVQSKDFKASKCRHALRKLERGYNDVLETDAELASVCLNRIGDAHALFADALKNDAERRNSMAVGHAPYERAMPEYARAVSAYTQAYQQAVGHDGQAETAQYAAQQAFDVTVRQGDVIAEWGNTLFGHAPTNQLGADSRKPRLDYLNQSVVPIFTAALEMYGQALELSRQMPLEEPAAALRAKLDAPLRPLAGTLTALIVDYAHTLNASAAELGSMSYLSFDAPTTERQEVKVEMELAQMLEAQRRVRPVMTDWNTMLLAIALPAESQEFWNELNVRQFDELSGALKAVQDNVVKSLSRGKLTNDVADMVFRRKLTKLQARAVSEEYRTLVLWHEFASTAGMRRPDNDKLFFRLAEVDPVHYGTIPNSGTATRRNP